MARGGRTGRNTLMQISKIRDLQRKHMKQDAPTRRLSTFLGALLVSVPCFASLYPLPTDGSSIVGEDTSVTTVYEDTLPDLAHRFSLGYYEIIRANPGVECGSRAPTSRSCCPAVASCPRGRAKGSW